MSIPLLERRMKGKDTPDFGQLARLKGQGLVLTILERARNAPREVPPHWRKAARARRRDDVAPGLGKGKFISALERELGGVDISALGAGDRGRLAALKKTVSTMREDARSGRLRVDQEISSTGRVAARAFDIVGPNRTATKDGGSGLFDLAARAEDEATRRSLRGAFERGLVSDVSLAKGVAWPTAARGLASLGMIGKDDPRAVFGKGLHSRDRGVERDEVNSGTASTSVKQMGLSFNDATRTIGNRIDSAMRRVPEGVSMEAGLAARLERGGLDAISRGEPDRAARANFSAAAEASRKANVAMKHISDRNRKGTQR